MSEYFFFFFKCAVFADYETLRIVGLSIAGVLVFLSILLLVGRCYICLDVCMCEPHKKITQEIIDYLFYLLHLACLSGNRIGRCGKSRVSVRIV